MENMGGAMGPACGLKPTERKRKPAIDLILRRWTKAIQKSKDIKCTAIFSSDYDSLDLNVFGLIDEGIMRLWADNFIKKQTECEETKLDDSMVIKQVREVLSAPIRGLQARPMSEEIVMTRPKKARLVAATEVPLLRTQGLSYKEIAAITKLPITTFNNLMRKSRLGNSQTQLETF